MKGRLGVSVKLLLYDLEVTGSNHGNSLLLCRIKLRTINTSSRPRIGGSFEYRAALFLNKSVNNLFKCHSKFQHNLLCQQ